MAASLKVERTEMMQRLDMVGLDREHALVERLSLGQAPLSMMLPRLGKPLRRVAHNAAAHHRRHAARYRRSTCRARSLPSTKGERATRSRKVARYCASLDRSRASVHAMSI